MEDGILGKTQVDLLLTLITTTIIMLQIYYARNGVIQLLRMVLLQILWF
jgi:hypothetical protein